MQQEARTFDLSRPLPIFTWIGFDSLTQFDTVRLSDLVLKHQPSVNCVSKFTFGLIALGLNHLKEMPSLPGSAQPSLAITGGARSKAKGKAKPKAAAIGTTDEPRTPKQPKKRKGDEELLLLDLKRQHLVMKNNFAPCLN